MSGAALFTWLQDAAFYRDMHERAAELLPRGEGKSWLDVGCGPGLLARIAFTRGYRVRGIDRSPSMIAAATRLAAERAADVDFSVSDIEREAQSSRTYDVVSASSLLVVVPDAAAALSQLEALVAPGGSLLIIEASEGMSRWRALRAIAPGRLGSRSHMLLAWAMARSGRTLSPSVFRNTSGLQQRTQLLDGLAEARLITNGALPTEWGVSA